MQQFMGWLFALAAIAGLCLPVTAETMSPEEIAKLVEPPYQLGEPFGPGQWELMNLDGRVAGYAFETEPLAPLPGFSGAPINMLVQVTTEGTFIDVDLIAHNEPIFVSGLGQAPFHEFVRQYKGHSITDTLVVGVPYGDKGSGSSLVYLEGVTKATASVRIAHESILAAAFAVAREKVTGIGSRNPVQPDFERRESLTWSDLVDEGIATRRLVTNAEADAAFKGSLWADDDPLAKTNPEAPYLDLWLVDVGPPSVAKAVLSPDTLEQLQEFQKISEHDEPILVIDAGRHGLVGPDFVRNTSPDLMFARQDGLPIALRDADLFVELAGGVPGNTAMILRTDRRLGFDPTREWEFTVRAVREHGSFRPEIGTVDFGTMHQTPARFYQTVETFDQAPPWQQAISQRAADLWCLSALLAAAFAVLLFAMRPLASVKHFTAIRLTFLAMVIGFVGWWGQGQLSIVTVLGVVRGVLTGQSMEFLLYDPFSLLIWVSVIVSFVLWGRGLFCGWLCPFGAMQEFAHHLGRLLRLPIVVLPKGIDGVLVNLKYAVLALLVLTALTWPALNDKLIEVEPFKTAITTFFVREWYYVAYAAGLLVLSMIVFKGFCRYVCPLGAFMAIGGMLRGRDWIPRKAECGSPCQLCKVRCNYQAIKPTGEIAYEECFQCLDCITIHDDETQCVPLVLSGKRALRPSGKGQPVPVPASIRARQ